MSSHGYWELALVIGLVAALIVAALLVLLIRSVSSIEASVNGLLEAATNESTGSAALAAGAGLSPKTASEATRAETRTGTRRVRARAGTWSADMRWNPPIYGPPWRGSSVSSAQLPGLNHHRPM